MAVIIMSSSSKILRKEMAEDLSRKLGYGCLSREEITDQATDAGIPIGKLEMSVLKGSVSKEGLARLKQRYLSFVTAKICEQACSGNLIYHGRSGALLLPSVSHIFRVRLIPHPESRIQSKMLRYRMDRQQAEEYVQQVDRDIERWVRTIHGQDINDPRLYDLILNLENMSLANASTALCSLAELPDFRPTPVSIQAMQDHCLGAQTRLRLALDHRTAEADCTVSANQGIVTVTYMPRQSQIAKFIPEVLAEFAGVKEIRITMANTNILWIQEAFHPKSEAFGRIYQVAQRWGAAVELLRFTSAPGIPAIMEEGFSETSPAASQASENTGGIEDDVPDPVKTKNDQGLAETTEELIRLGRSGGTRSLKGTLRDLSAAVDPNIKYSLVVIGNLFLSKPKAAQIRMLRELKMILSEKIRVPVISADELQQKYFLGSKQIIQMLIYLAIVFGVYGWTLRHEEAVLGFIQTYKGWKLLSTIAVVLLAPLIAYLYGTVVHLFLKMIKFD